MTASVNRSSTSLPRDSFRGLVAVSASSAKDRTAIAILQQEAVCGRHGRASAAFSFRRACSEVVGTDTFAWLLRSLCPEWVVLYCVFTHVTHVRRL